MNITEKVGSAILLRQLRSAWPLVGIGAAVAVNALWIGILTAKMRTDMVGRVELRDDLKEQAEWRREKAKQYPDDSATSKSPRSLTGWPSPFEANQCDASRQGVFA